MTRLIHPTRRALLVAADYLLDPGLRDGLYVITPDMRVYGAVYQRCLHEYTVQGRPMPYADADTASPHGHASTRHQAG